MLIVALVLAVIGLAALVTAVVTSNELVAWVCIGASALGVILLIVDAIRERKYRRLEALAESGAALGTAKSTRKAARTVPAVDTVPAVGAATAVVAKVEESGPDDAELGEVELEEFDDYIPEVEIPEVEIPVDIPEVDIPVMEIPEASEVEFAEYEFRAAEVVVEDHPEEIVHDEPEYDTYSDDEAEFPQSAEEAAVHVVQESTPDTSVVVYSTESPDSTVVYMSEGTGATETTRVVVSDEGR